MEELKDLTTNRLYEAYRKQKMLETGYDGSNPDNAYVSVVCGQEQILSKRTGL